MNGRLVIIRRADGASMQFETDTNDMRAVLLGAVKVARADDLALTVHGEESAVDE